MKRQNYVFLMVIAASMLSMLSGCASTTPTAKFSQEITTDNHINSSDEVKVVVIPEDKVEILDVEKTRISQRIEERVNTKKILNSSGAGKKTIRIEVVLKRYEKGNAFARAMLAGLGQIHIEGTVRVINCDNEIKICEFELDKTFAWGGLYGASTSMEDIERTFADGIAETVTGQKEDPQKKS